MGKIVDLLGRKFNRLTVIGYKGFNKYGRTEWVCKCDCGNEVIVGGNSLMTGNTRSCGCYKIDATKKNNTRHGGTKGYKWTPEFEAWMNMRRRCLEKNNPARKNYSERGIGVCKRWQLSFAAFLKDMGKRPSKYHSLDRFPNNDGDYKPSNCRWATEEQQRRNKRTNVYLEYNNERMVMADWATKTGISKATIFARLKRGWTVADTLSTPILTKLKQLT